MSAPARWAFGGLGVVFLVAGSIGMVTLPGAYRMISVALLTFGLGLFLMLLVLARTGARDEGRGPRGEGERR
jgi:hypothetical protein